VNPPAGAIASLNASGPVIGGVNPPAGAIASLNAFPLEPAIHSAQHAPVPSLLPLLLLSQPAVELDVGKDLRLPLVVVSPSSGTGRVSLTEINSAFADAVAKATPLSLDLLDVSLADCALAFGCLFSRVLEVQRKGAEHGLLLFISHQPFPGHEDRVVVRLVDLTQTARLISEGADEIALSSQAFLAKPEAGLIADRTALLAYAAKAVAALEPNLRQKKLWGATGDLALELPSGPAQLFVDDQPVGSAGPGAVRIRGITADRHRLRVDREGFLPFDAEVEVTAGAELAVAVALLPRPVSPVERVRTETWIGGGVALIAGVAFLIAGGVEANQNGLHCALAGSSAVCRQSPPRLLAPSPEEPSSAGRGPLTAALGYSLAGAGGAAIGTELLFDGAHELPWWVAPAAGMLVGAALYGMSEALVAR